MYYECMSYFIGGNMERYLRYAGLIRLDNLNIWDAMRVLSPEVIMLATAIVVLILCRAINRSPSDAERLLPVVSTPPSEAEKVTERQTFSILTILGKFWYHYYYFLWCVLICTLLKELNPFF